MIRSKRICAVARIAGIVMGSVQPAAAPHLAPGHETN